MPHLPTPVSTPSLSPRGVFDADPFDQPVPPIGAHAVKIRDSSGRIIAYGWAVREHSEQLAANAWTWLDERDGPPIRLVK